MLKMEESYCVTDGKTDGRTDGCTDGRIDLMYSYAVSTTL